MKAILIFNIRTVASMVALIQVAAMAVAVLYLAAACRFRFICVSDRS